MSDYHQHRYDSRTGRPLDYTAGGSGTGLWGAIGAVAVLALLALIVVAGSNGTPEDTAPATGGEIAPPAPAVAE